MSAAHRSLSAPGGREIEAEQQPSAYFAIDEELGEFQPPLHPGTGPGQPEPAAELAAPNQEEHPQMLPYQSPLEDQLTLTPPRSRVPFLIAVGIAALVVLGTLAAVLISVSAPSGQGKSVIPFLAAATSTPVDPSASLDLSYQSMSKLNSMQYQSEAGFYGVLTPVPNVTGTSAITLTITGDVVQPGSYTVNADQPQIGQYVVISDTTWSRRNGNTDWVEQPTSALEMGLLNPTVPVSFLHYAQPGARDAGTETSDGVLLRHIRFQVDTARMMSDTSESALSAILSRSRINADAWIRDKDHLLDRLSAAVDMGSGQGVILQIRYSGYNAQLVIKAPGSQ